MKSNTDLLSELNNTPIISGQELLLKDFEISADFNKTVRRQAHSTERESNFMSELL